MSNEEIQIKIAESLSWKQTPFGEPLNEHPRTWRTLADLPNYPESLDACAEFEKTLTFDESWEYAKLLMDYKQSANGFPLASKSEVFKLQKATAIDRCLAYLRTKNLIP